MEFLFLLAILAIMIPTIIIAEKMQMKELREKSTEELIGRYNEIEKDIKGRIAAVEVFCKGTVGSMVTDSHNKKIDKLREEGKKILQVLAERGVSLDANRLSGKAKMTPGNSKASVTGRAIVGGILGGPTGAIIGAKSAEEKNRKIEQQEEFVRNLGKK